MRRRGFADRANRPVGGDPSAGRVRQNSRKFDHLARVVDRGGLHRGDLMLAKGLAHNLQSTRE